jgi:divalent anion:Na+ symporter, DASS family
MQAAFQGNVVTSAMFLTAMAANPLAAKLAAGMHIDVSWGEWALAAAVPGVTSLVLIPLILYQGTSKIKTGELTGVLPGPF